MSKEKIVKGETFENTRKFVDFLNENKITKEDIISVFSRMDLITLVYYGQK